IRMLKRPEWRWSATSFRKRTERDRRILRPPLEVAVVDVVEAVLATHAPVPATDLETIEAADRWARERARAEVLARSG
ncbi:hypothetical protein AB1399_09685, partial [Hydrogenibacillus schlegelii]